MTFSGSTRPRHRRGTPPTSTGSGSPSRCAGPGDREGRGTRSAPFLDDPMSPPIYRTRVEATPPSAKSKVNRNRLRLFWVFCPQSRRVDLAWVKTNGKAVFLTICFRMHLAMYGATCMLRKTCSSPLSQWGIDGGGSNAATMMWPSLSLGNKGGRVDAAQPSKHHRWGDATKLHYCPEGSLSVHQPRSDCPQVGDQGGTNLSGKPSASENHPCALHPSGIHWTLQAGGTFTGWCSAGKANSLF